MASARVQKNYLATYADWSPSVHSTFGYVPPRGGGGEAGRFVDLMVDIADRAPGVSAFVADGALRGTHIARVQNETGCPLISPARRKSKERGGIVIGKYGHATAQLPPSRARTAWIEQCGGHVLYAAGGTIYERVVTADGSLDFVEVPRRQTKRDRKSDGTWAFYARHTLTCRSTDDVHDWWEPLTPTQTDEANNFNRSDYLRVLPQATPWKVQVDTSARRNLAISVGATLIKNASQRVVPIGTNIGTNTGVI